MLKELLKNIKFRSKINSFFKGNEAKVIDIILFGSVVREKESPRDIDIMIIFKSAIEHESIYELRKSIEHAGLSIEITAITYKELFSPNFIARESFLSEGYSLINKNFISEGLGFSSFVLFRYDISKLNKSDRMRFYYSLYGRNKKCGILAKLKSQKFSDNIIITPIIHSEQLKDYLTYWKIGYTETPAIIPLRIVESKQFKQKGKT